LLDLQLIMINFFYFIITFKTNIIIIYVYTSKLLDYNYKNTYNKKKFKLCRIKIIF